MAGIDKAIRIGGVVLVALTALTGCSSSIGAKTVVRDQFDYAEALRDAAKEQMLLNRRRW